MHTEYLERAFPTSGDLLPRVEYLKLSGSLGYRILQLGKVLFLNSSSKQKLLLIPTSPAYSKEK